jgi:hypothetical protein
MLNNELFDRFLDFANGKKVLEIGVKDNSISVLKKSCDVTSFDISTSALKFNVLSRFKQNSLVKLPFKDGEFFGSIIYKTLGYGDKNFLFDEILRVSSDIILLVEDSIESYPIDYFSTFDDLILDSFSKDGEVEELGTTFMEFFSRRDLIHLFYKPGGALNKFNLLVPEDIKMEIGLLCRKV